MSKAISVILNLRDNASKGLVGVAKNTKGVSREMQSATRTVVKWKDKFVDSLSTVASKATKWAATTTAALASVALTTGFSEAIDLEGYRMQLETATKDTEKAASLMSYATELANKTPFEAGTLVEAAAKFESMGMSAEKWLTRTGNMAAATSKDFDQATEALIDAQTGELERLKEFGITKAQILEKGEEMFSGVQIANNNGQIVDQEKFNEAMIALMDEKFSGGMEKQATTLKGTWSTITGVVKSSLAKIVGMNEDGSVRAGSAFDILREKLQVLSEKFQQWQSDGTIDRLAEKFSELAQKAVEAAEQLSEKVVAAFDWVTEHSGEVKTALKVLGIAFAAVKIAGFIGNVAKTIDTVSKFVDTIKRINEVWGVVSKASAVVKPVISLITGGAGLIHTVGAGILSVIGTIGGVITGTIIPGIVSIASAIGSFIVGTAIPAIASFVAAFGPIILAVTAVIAVGVLLYKNWDTIKAKAAELATWVVTKWTELKTGAAAVWNGLKTSVSNAITAICTRATNLKTKVVTAFNGIKTGITNAFNKVKSAVSGVFDWFSSKFSWISDKISWLKETVSGLPGVSTALSALGIGSNATGTTYWRGGLTSINEHGGEIVDLPSGTRIIPHDVSQKMAGGNNITVNLTVAGNVIGNREYMEQTGEYIASKIMAAMDIA